MKTALFLLFTLLFTGCVTFPVTTSLTKQESLLLRPTDFDSLPLWDENDHTKALHAFIQSCDTKQMTPLLRSVCDELPTTLDAKSFFETYFRPFIWSHDDEENIITGYYEPLLQASSLKHEGFIHPVLSTPKDLLRISIKAFKEDLPDISLRGRVVNNTVVPYYTREEIIRQEPKENVIAWVEDPVDLFFLQVQGSGRLVIDGDQTIFVGYGDKNGYTYKSIGRYLIEKGLMKKEQMSLEGIKTWARNNPDLVDDVLNQNPSYLFFHENKSPAKGAQGVVLTAEHSCAVDTTFIPLGTPLFINTDHPTKEGRLARLTIAQDRGAAIKGKRRIDFFWGFGEDAAHNAGNTKSSGEIVLLLPKEAHLDQRVTQ